MSELPSVYVVTPVHDGIAHTMRFLETLAHQDYANLVTIIVDDGSTDGTSEATRERFPSVVTLRCDGDRWWSGSTNVGVRHALGRGADFILTINNDVELAPNYVRTLVTCARENPGALIGSVVYDANDRDDVYFYGAYFDRKLAEPMHHTGRRADVRDVRASEWLTGMGVLVPAEAFNRVGLYNEREFPQYFGDADFSLRARRMGYALLVNPASEVYADVRSSWRMRQMADPKLSFWPKLFFSRRSPYHVATRWRFYRRYWPGNAIAALLRLYLIGMIGLHVNFAAALIKKRLGLTRLRPKWMRRIQKAHG